MTNFAAVNGKLYFTAYLSGRYYFWKSDGTETGTISFMPVQDIGIMQIEPHFLSFQGNVYFVNGGGIGGVFLSGSAAAVRAKALMAVGFPREIRSR